MNDNGKLLHAVRAGMPDDASLHASQIELLELYGLLRRDGNRVVTDFPIIEPDATARLRASARIVAQDCLPKLQGPTDRLQAALARRGWSASAPSLLFGYAFDFLVWELLGQADALPQTHLTLEKPLWNGVFWALYPPRILPAGLNIKRFGPRSLLMIWTEPTLAMLHALAATSELNDALSRTIQRKKNVELRDVDGRLWKLTGPDGTSNLPIIRAHASDDIHDQAMQVAVIVTDALVHATLPSLPGVEDDRVRRVIFAHEVIWELSDLMQGATRDTLPESGRNDLPPITRLVLGLRA